MLHAVALGLLGLSLCGAASSAVSGCSGWDPRHPFERNAPEVDEAIGDLDGGKPESAEAILEKYLGTGMCSDGGLGLPDSVRKKPNASFDLGLTLFALGERFGHRFGDEDLSDAGDDPQAAARSAEIDCALIVVKAIASDPSVPIDLRARARYLAGNLEFLRKKYEEAVKHYDQALELIPGLSPEAGGDGIGRDAAWNRAIALRRIEDQKDASPPDAEPDAQPDAPPDASPDSPDGDDGNDGNDGDDGNDGNDGSDAPDSADAPPDSSDGGEDGGKDDAGEDGGKGDAGSDGGTDGGKSDGGADGGPSQQPQPQPQQPQQDERILDQLEEAPTYQEQEAKARAGVRRGRVMEDK
ncbi:MAG: tetratricopeptide repeat protein [Byssovorax sp.]